MFTGLVSERPEIMCMRHVVCAHCIWPRVKNKHVFLIGLYSRWGQIQLTVVPQCLEYSGYSIIICWINDQMKCNKLETNPMSIKRTMVNPSMINPDDVIQWSWYKDGGGTVSGMWHQMPTEIGPATSVSELGMTMGVVGSWWAGKPMSSVYLNYSRWQYIVIMKTKQTARQESLGFLQFLGKIPQIIEALEFQH